LSVRTWRLTWLLLAWLVGCGASTGSQAKSTAPGDALSPEAMRAMTRGARALEEGKRLDAAERHLRNAVSLSPGMWEAHYDLGVVLWRLGKLQPACASFGQAHATAPGQRTAVLALARCEHARGQHGRAGELLSQLVEAAPEDSEARLSYCAVLRGAGLGVAGLAGAALIGCGGGDDDEGSGTGQGGLAGGQLTATAVQTTVDANATAVPADQVRVVPGLYDGPVPPSAAELESVFNQVAQDLLVRLAQ